MSRSTTKKVFLTGLLLSLSLAPAMVAADSPAANSKDTASKVMAKVGNATITEADVEQAAAGQLRALDQQRHKILENGLDKAVDQKLIELEAAKRGVTPDELVKKEVTDKVGEVSDSEVKDFYEARKAQIRAPEAQIAPRIKQYLQQQRQREVYSSFIDGLKKEYKVQTFLEPLRVKVAEAGAPAKGPKDAPIRIIEFSDFQCPFCGRIEPEIEKVLKTYGNKVRLVYRQFPLTQIHPFAQKAAEASLCAKAQGKFWEMHDAMFSNQSALGVDQLKATAKKLGLDSKKFDKCLDSGAMADAVAADEKAGQAAGVNGTPALFINGRFINGAVPYEQISKIIDEELASKGMASSAKTEKSSAKSQQGNPSSGR
ncbi:MAG TPA: thioredoxin domain-containing protein [Thermoanaerobaculia bacterium]|nr:thioredoxin domain-containing protein [Thermoanaerobaculia bacterium]